MGKHGMGYDAWRESEGRNVVVDCGVRAAESVHERRNWEALGRKVSSLVGD